MVQARRELGGFDLMVNNNSPALCHNETLGDIETAMRIVVQGTIWGIEAATALFREDGTKGTIVNVCSSAGLEKTDAVGFYSAAKENLRVITKVAAKQLVNSGIHVSLQCFGSIVPSQRYT